MYKFREVIYVLCMYALYGSELECSKKVKMCWLSEIRKSVVWGDWKIVILTVVNKHTKGTVNVICSEPPPLKSFIPDSQRYLLNFYLTQ